MNAINPSDLQVCKILNIRQVGQYVGLSRSTIYELINPKSKYFDCNFPKPISLTTHRIGWVASEINAWLESRIAQR